MTRAEYYMNLGGSGVRALLLTHWPVMLGWVVALSAVGFVLMGLDKGRARRGDWRIPERTLFLVALLGGVLGTLLGMQVFRHKTKHASFRVGLPLILVLHIAMVVCCLVWK